MSRSRDTFAEERDEVVARVLAEVAHPASQQRQGCALRVVLLLWRRPVELDDLPGRGGAAPQYRVHVLDAGADLVDAVAQVLGDLLDERVAEHAAFLRGQHALALGDLAVELGDDRAERLLTGSVADLDEQDAVDGLRPIRVHVGFCELTIEQRDPALHLHRERTGTATHGEELGGQRACDLECARDRPVVRGVGIRWRGVTEHEAEDAGGRERRQGGCCRLALSAPRFGLALLRLRVVLETRGLDRSRLSARAFLACGLACRAQFGGNRVMACTQILAGMSQHRLACPVLGGQAIRFGALVGSRMLGLCGLPLGLGHARPKRADGRGLGVGALPRTPKARHAPEQLGGCLAELVERRRLVVRGEAVLDGVLAACGVGGELLGGGAARLGEGSLVIALGALAERRADPHGADRGGDRVRAGQRRELGGERVSPGIELRERDVVERQGALQARRPRRAGRRSDARVVPRARRRRHARHAASRRGP